MTDQTAFLPEEWDVLIAGVLQPAMAISTAERGGTLSEMLAMYETLATRLQKQIDQPLIQALLKQLVSDKATNALKAYERIDAEQLRTLCLESLSAALALLDARAEPSERASYVQIVHEVCRQVAEANAEGSRLGADMMSVSNAEGEMLYLINERLGLL